MKFLYPFGVSAYSIQDLQIFSDVTDRRLGDLLADCPVVQVAMGQSVVNLLDKSPRLYVVLRGILGVSSEGINDASDNVLTTVLAGECVGELSVLDEESNPADIGALEESDLLVIDADKLWQIIDESNGVARNLLRLLSFRIRAANAQIRRRQRVGEFYRQLSMVDGLTNLQNRSWLSEHLPTLITQAHAAENPLSLIMIDLDHFKLFNDQYGHLAGDDALRVAAMVLSDTLRPRDFAVRYGGEEFMVILPNTNKKSGAIVAQRLCDRMQQARVFADPKHKFPHITASLGLACLVPDQDANGLIAMADAALYRAKNAGRNQVAT